MGRPKLVPKPVPKSRTASGPFLKPKPIWQKAKSKELLPEKTAGGSTFFGKPNLIHRDEAWWLGGSCQTRLRNNCNFNFRKQAMKQWSRQVAKLQTTKWKRCKAEQWLRRKLLIQQLLPKNTFHYYAPGYLITLNVFDQSLENWLLSWRQSHFQEQDWPLRSFSRFLTKTTAILRLRLVHDFWLRKGLSLSFL